MHLSFAKWRPFCPGRPRSRSDRYRRIMACLPGTVECQFSNCKCSMALLRHTYKTLQWRHNERDGVSNHWRLDYLLNRLFRPDKKTSKLRVTGLCEGNPSVTGGFSSQRASNAENVPIDDVIMRHLHVWGPMKSQHTMFYNIIRPWNCII